jgi:uncharacterized protein
MSEKGESSGFDLYTNVEAGGEGLIQVSDPLHRQILDGLMKSPLSTTEISALTGKAQSTLSVHLDQMVKDKLISADFDPADTRRKIYRLSSNLWARSIEPNSSGWTLAKQAFYNLANSKGDYYTNMVRALALGMQASGLDVSPVVRSLGEFVGFEIAENIQSTKIEDIITHIQEFYEINNVGEVCIYTFLPLTIIVKAPESNPGFPLTAKLAFSEGLFKSVLNTSLGKNYDITSEEIFGADNNYYKFVIELVK